MGKEGNGLQCLKYIFPRLSEAKLKEDLFIGRQIREILDVFSFQDKLNEKVFK